MRISLQFVTPVLIITCLFGSSCSKVEPTADATTTQRYILGLSPFLSQDHKDEVFRRIVGFVLEDARVGSSVWIYDAYHNATIARIDIPNTRVFASPKTRASQFKDSFARLKDFLAQDSKPPDRDDIDFQQAVRLPQFTTFIADNLDDTPNPTAALVIGSPLYVDEKEESFSMLDGYFPSDAHLHASRERSVYSTEGRDSALANVSLHLGWFGDPWTSKIHHDKIRRFWSLYLQQQGGRLASFAGDLPTAFGRFVSKAAFDDQYAIDPEQTRVEMLRISREAGVSDWITRDLSSAAPSPVPKTTTGPMKIGIRWTGDIDLDLYARPSPEDQTLYFQNARSESGLYFKDHRSSPDREYEFVEFVKPVDCLAADAWVNFYDGESTSPISGEARIEFDGRVYAQPFTIAASRGNQGQAGTDQSTHWTRLDIPDILSLR